MRKLGIDIETYSSTDLPKCGVYKYVQSPDFTITLFAYAFDDEPVRCIDLANGEEIPDEVIDALTDSQVLKTAHNANFEITCISEYLFTDLDVSQWECTMIKSATLGLPFGLDIVGKVLGLTEQKDAEGKALIKYFAMPCKPTKVNGGRIRNLPSHDPVKWAKFIQYCIKDVIVEREIRTRISIWNTTPIERELWFLDQRINARGVTIDRSFVNNAIAMNDNYRDRLTEEAIDLTKLRNPNSVAQLRTWLWEALGGEEIKTLRKSDIPLILATTDDKIVRRVLEIRQEMSKTSVKKYNTMRITQCSDQRVRGLLQFYGANRTGRWAGRLVQVQNLPKNSLVDLDLARKLVADNDLEFLELAFGNVPDTLSQLIRTAFIPKPKHRFLVADFSAIEARVIAWLAGEKWRIDVFNGHGKIYEASAAAMFGVPIEAVTKTSDYRAKGKIAELALGYQGSVNALIVMGALKMGLIETELPDIVKLWRKANRKIVSLWYTVGDAAIRAVDTGSRVKLQFGIEIWVERGIMFIKLPSGRNLAYIRPRLKEGAFGPAVVYEGMDQTTKRWGRQDTYGGKLVENIVQAIARDCLRDALLRTEKAGYPCVMHVHDEILAEMPIGEGSIEDLCKIMGQPVSWAPTLPLAADGFETMYYRKD